MIKRLGISPRAISMVAALSFIGLSLSGCVVYPSGGYGYSSGYGSSYYEPAYVPPPVYGDVVIGGFFGGGHGYRGYDRD